MALKMNTPDIEPMIVSNDEIKASPQAEEEPLELEDGEIDDSDESNSKISPQNNSDDSQGSRHKKSSHKKKKKSKRNNGDDKLSKHKKRKVSLFFMKAYEVLVIVNYV